MVDKLQRVCYYRTMTLTYAELAEQIAQMTPQQRQSNVTVYVQGVAEYYPVVGDYPLCYADGEKTDVLDQNHPYLVI